MNLNIKLHYSNYIKKLNNMLEISSLELIEELANSIHTAWKNKNTLYICGNGGSAGNAIHLANDFNYGISKGSGLGMRVEALPANSSVLTCLANDIGYENIFSQQLEVKANKDDLLLVLSGSGNSPNILKALEIGNKLQMKTFAILGYSGGKAKSLARYPIHFEINDMQISEDLQLIVGHIIMQWLCEEGNK
jgi:D-sedoheptulose 7-phosphate isomerase